MRFLLFGVLLASALLSGCAHFDSRPFNAEANHSIQTIGLLPFGQHSQPDIVLANLPGDSVGLIGAVISEGQRKIATVKFQRMTTAQQFQPVVDTRAAVKKALEADGYRVVDVPATRTDAAKFMTPYPKADGSVDAYMDIYTETVGYLSASSRDFRPTVYLGAKLVRASDAQILFSDRVLVNAYGTKPDGVTIDPPAGYEYHTEKALIADAPHAVEGIRKAIALAADALAARIRK